MQLVLDLLLSRFWLKPQRYFTLQCVNVKYILYMLYRYRKMWYECQWDNSPSKQQFKNKKKVNHYRSMYGLQHGASAHTEQQAIRGPKMVFCG